MKVQQISIFLENKAGRLARWQKCSGIIKSTYGFDCCGYFRFWNFKDDSEPTGKSMRSTKNRRFYGEAKPSNRCAN